jgi:hypothetical protein
MLKVKEVNYFIIIIIEFIIIIEQIVYNRLGSVL